jgi:hypothetical protein
MTARRDVLLGRDPPNFGSGKNTVFGRFLKATQEAGGFSGSHCCSKIYHWKPLKSRLDKISPAEMPAPPLGESFRPMHAPMAWVGIFPTQLFSITIIPKSKGR